MTNDVAASSTTSSDIQSRRHILYVDSYDSFSNSIVGLLKQNLDADVTTVRIDDEDATRNLDLILKSFDAVVVGPGPGHPANARDVGLINQLWKLGNEDLLPILGICLGFQSLCLTYNAEIKRLSRARHGIVSKMLHSGADIFEGVSNLHATQYHSLHVDLGSLVQKKASFEASYWEPTLGCPELYPLAWDVDDEVNGPILMSVRHNEKPFWGVQFHPESICTTEEGAKVVCNWWVQAKDWLTTRDRVALQDRSIVLDNITPITDTLSVREHNESQKRDTREPTGSVLAQTVQSSISNELSSLRTRHSTGSIDPVTLIEALKLQQDEVILLDSQGHNMGRYSILGLVIPNKTVKVTYDSWNRTLRYGSCSTDEHFEQLQSIDQIWPMLQEVLDLYDPRKASDYRKEDEDVQSDSPFWGGFMGYISYEAGLETIDVELHDSSATSPIPDINFAFVQRSIVIDHVAGRIYVQSLSPNDQSWMLEVGRAIDNLSRNDKQRNAYAGPRIDLCGLKYNQEQLDLERRLALAHISTPQEHQYRNKVLTCQSSLASGDSYELCLTDETIITVPKLDSKDLNAWSLYKKLRRQNPAPFGAFLHLSNTTVLSTSPERFLTWSRTGHCQFRPIKGTVKKSPSTTRAAAHAILNSSKERAENLMIVDLIRHDLSGVIGASNTSVPKLMSIEEYEHVYQLVSVIEGQLPPSTDARCGKSGLDVLKASLPPGSMTGAPKKRSCEILRDIEKRPRGIYSGVLGYLDVGGAGDFAVVIRTAVRDADAAAPSSARESEQVTPSTSSSGSGATRRSSSAGSAEAELDAGERGSVEKWRIGAGGAVTIQSTDLAEFQEMEVKVMSALRAFKAA